MRFTRWSKSARLPQRLYAGYLGQTPAVKLRMVVK